MKMLCLAVLAYRNQYTLYSIGLETFVNRDREDLQHRQVDSTGKKVCLGVYQGKVALNTSDSSGLGKTRFRQTICIMEEVPTTSAL